MVASPAGQRQDPGHGKSQGDSAHKNTPSCLDVFSLLDGRDSLSENRQCHHGSPKGCRQAHKELGEIDNPNTPKAVTGLVPLVYHLFSGRQSMQHLVRTKTGRNFSGRRASRSVRPVLSHLVRSAKLSVTERVTNPNRANLLFQGVQPYLHRPSHPVSEP